MELTPNLGLKKPGGSDVVDITNFNDNADILDAAIIGKMDKISGKQLSTEDYTTAEKSKLAGIAAGANNYTHPANHPPTIITQDSNNRFVTDAEKSTWNGKAGTAAATTSANGLMSSMDKTKLDGIAAGANNYTHPSGDGNQHVPATGTTNNGKVLKSGSTAGSSAWGNVAFSEVTGRPTTLSGYGITDAAPASHAGSGGTAHADATTTANGFMTAADKVKLNGIAAGANNYVHPAGDGNLHVPATGTANNGKVLKAGGTAGSVSWGTLAKGDVGLGNVENTADSTKNVLSATKWTTARNIALTGNATGSASIDGTGNVSIATTVVDNSHNHNKMNRIDLTGQTIDINTLNFSDDTRAAYYIEKTSGGATNITNIPVAGQAFLLDVESVRYAGTSDYITKQTFVSSQDKVVRTRWCTSGVWSSWIVSYDTSNPQTTISGNAATATKLQVERNISLAGDVTGSASFDGSGNISITATVADDSHAHIISNVDGLQAALDAKVNGSDVATAAAANKILKLDTNSKLPASITGNADGNANTATKWASARTLSLTGDVAGSASVDGSANVSIAVTVADDSHNHIIGNVDGLQTALDSKLANTDYIRQPGYGTTAGSANAYTLTLSPVLSAYTAGICVAVKIHAANTGTSTININGLGAKSILDSKGNTLPSGKLRLNGVYTLRYDGTNFILQGEGGEYGNVSAENVDSGVSFGTDNGLQTGTSTKKKWASGTIGNFTAGYNESLIYTINVPFAPSTVLFQYNMSNNNGPGVCQSCSTKEYGIGGATKYMNSNTSAWLRVKNWTTNSADVWQYCMYSGVACINITWIAIE